MSNTVGIAIMACGGVSFLAWLLTSHDVLLHRSWLEVTWIIPAVALAQMVFGAIMWVF